EGDRDRVGPDVGELRGRGRQGVVQRVAVDGAGDRRGERRVVVAVGLGLVVGGDVGRPWGDRQRAIDVRERVVVIDPTRAGDRVVAHVGELAGGRRTARLGRQGGRP